MPDVAPADDAGRMDLAIALAARNVQEGTGGPFGALVLDGAGRVVGAGVNTVVENRSSIAHAEVMALTHAQQRLGRHRLSDPPASGPYALVTSAQPCIMCFGASFWAGIGVLVVGARADDVEELAGFDEGPVPPDWVDELSARGIEVRRDVRREQAAAVLRAYGERDGKRY